MDKVFFMALSVVICYLIEHIFSNLFGLWFNPNLLIILIVFFNLFRGIRYSLCAAILAGLLKDCYATKAFGLNIFSFVLCAYITTFLKIYIYHSGSTVSRMLLVFFICLINLSIQYVLNMMYAFIGFSSAFYFVIVPEVLATTLAAPYVFKNIRICALRLFA